MVGLRYSVIGCGLTIQRNSFKEFTMYDVYAMAVLTNQRLGTPFTLYILADDHAPAHMHLARTRKSPTLARIIITDVPPANIDDIRIRRDPKNNNQVSVAIKRAIVEWANSPNPTIPGITNWRYAQATWTSNNNGHAVFLSLEDALAYC